MESFERAVDQTRQVTTELRRVILGQHGAIDVITAAIVAGGHVLLEDQPGVGKTTLARAIATVFGLDMKRVQGTTDLLPTDITGVHVFQPATGDWNFRPGPVLASMLLVDEMNRATPKAQSALLEAMAERQVTVDGETFPTPHPHVVIATQNPTGEAGTHRLVSAQLDRFAVSVHLGLPGRAAERTLLDRPADLRPQAIVTPEVLLELRDAASALAVGDNVKEHVLDVVAELRDLLPDVWLSARVPQIVLSVARGLALVDGRDYVDPDDVRNSLPAVVGHRLPQRVTWEQAQTIVDSVAVPS